MDKLYPVPKDPRDASERPGFVTLVQHDLRVHCKGNSSLKLLARHKFWPQVKRQSGYVRNAQLLKSAATGL